MRKLDPEFEYLVDMYEDPFFKPFLVDKLKSTIVKVVDFIEESSHTIEEIQRELYNNNPLGAQEKYSYRGIMEELIDRGWNKDSAKVYATDRVKELREQAIKHAKNHNLIKCT